MNCHLILSGVEFSFARKRDCPMSTSPRFTALILILLAQFAYSAVSTQPATSLKHVAPTTAPAAVPKPKSTAAFQKAIDTCASNGGGTVQIGPGNYLIGSIELRSGVTL